VPDLFIAEDGVEPEVWLSELQGLHNRLKPYFSNLSAWSTAGGYVVGLLSSAERKNAWQMAEAIGAERPSALQNLLRDAKWDEEGVRDAVRSFVYERLGDAAGVHVLDETSYVKKGTASVGVKRQYCGSVGKLENCQVAVFLAYASPKGAALVDRRLFLPEDWAADSERREKAKVPTDVDFASKSELGLVMLQRAFAAGAPKGWVAGDEAYGKNGNLRKWLVENGHPFVLAVASNEPAWRNEYFETLRVSDILECVKKREWRRMSAGSGTKGERVYDWAWAKVPSTACAPWSHWLLFRRNTTTGELAYYKCAGPADTPLEELVRVAGARWAIEVCFEQAKGEVGLDHYEVRSWHGWHRHTSLSMLALAYLAAMRAMGAKGGFPSRRAEARGMQEFKADRAEQERREKQSKRQRSSHSSG
jgi:SRSO17 transposase